MCSVGKRGIPIVCRWHKSRLVCHSLSINDLLFWGNQPAIWVHHLWICKGFVAGKASLAVMVQFPPVQEKLMTKAPSVFLSISQSTRAKSERLYSNPFPCGLAFFRDIIIWKQNLGTLGTSSMWLQQSEALHTTTVWHTMRARHSWRMRHPRLVPIASFDVELSMMYPSQLLGLPTNDDHLGMVGGIPICGQPFCGPWYPQNPCLQNFVCVHRVILPIWILVKHSYLEQPKLV